MSEDLVQRAQHGDRAAFETLASGAVNRLYAVARRVLRDPVAAEDAVQECLFRAWRDLRALRDPARFDAWLYRLLLNACRDEQRRIGRRPVQVGLGERAGLSVDGGPSEVDRRDELERGFSRLSAEHRMVLVMHHYLGLRMREIADLLGIPEGTAVSRLHYGARALRVALEPESPPKLEGGRP